MLEGPDHLHVAHTYNSLGDVQRDLGDLQQAKEHYECAIDIRLKRLALRILLSRVLTTAWVIWVISNGPGAL